MKNHLLLLSFSLLMSLYGCGLVDPCHNKNCGPYGDCNDGKCKCNDGASIGSDGKCSVLDRDKFIRTYLTTTTTCNGQLPQGTPLDCSKGNSDNKMLITLGGSVPHVFTLTCQVSGQQFTIPEQYYGISNDKWSGSGSLSSNGGVLTITVTQTSSDTSIPPCTYNITGT
jgi:hypothetical protein